MTCVLWLCNPVYPHTYTQVLSLQFCTELTFISISPFSLEFFGMVLLKAMLNISLMGGLLFKLHIKFSGWCVHCLGRAGGQFRAFLVRVLELRCEWWDRAAKSHFG